MTDLKCILCPQGYLHALRDNLLKELQDYFDIQVAIYDIDAILEVGTRFAAIFEWKMKQESYQDYWLQTFEYVALKKLGKLMRTTPYFVNQILPDNIELILESATNPEEALYQNSTFVVFEIDRFERKEARLFERRNGVHYAIYSENEGRVMNFKQFRSFIGRLIMNASRTKRN